MTAYDFYNIFDKQVWPLVMDSGLRLVRSLTGNTRMPWFNFHWLREISSFEVIGTLTLDLRE